jgi:chaperone BCS1
VRGDRRSRVCQLVDSSCRILGGSHQFVQDLLTETQECWQKAKEEQVSIYTSDARNEWRLVASRPKRPLKSIILDTGVKEAILEDALDFLDSKEWYSTRGIPFRRGYLLVSHICADASSHR